MFDSSLNIGIFSGVVVVVLVILIFEYRNKLKLKITKSNYILLGIRGVNFFNNHKVGILCLAFTSIFYSIWENDFPFGILAFFIISFGFLFLISGFGKSVKIFRIGALIICGFYFLFYVGTDKIISDFNEKTYINVEEKTSNIKSIIQLEYDMIDENDKIIDPEYSFLGKSREERILFSNSGKIIEAYFLTENTIIKQTYEYDENDNLIKEITLSETGGTSKHYGTKVYYYNSNNNLIEENYFRADKQLSSITKYLYDKDNNLLVREIKKPNDENYLLREEYLYENNLKISYSMIFRERVKKNFQYIDEHKTDIWRANYFYDEQDILIKESFIENGSKKSDTFYYYENGNLTGEDIKSSDNNELEYSTLFTYDENGNKIQSYKMNSLNETDETCNYFYDSNNNWIKEDCKKKKNGINTEWIIKERDITYYELQ